MADKITRTLQTITCASKPTERHPWLEFDGAFRTMGRLHLDPAALASGLRPAIGDPIYVVTDTNFHFVGIENSRRRILVSMGKDAWKLPVGVMPTRQLLGLLAKVRKGYSDWEHPTPEDLVADGMNYSIEEVKAELAKRPHIPTDAPSLARWGYLLYGGRIIDGHLVETMTTQATVTDVGGYGFGTMVADWEGERIVGHLGDYIQYSSILLVWPSTKTAVALLAPAPGMKDTLPGWAIALYQHLPSR